MTHTSSIKDNWAAMSSYYGYPDPTLSLADCMASYFPTTGSNYNATQNFLNSNPGTSYQYSNMASALNGYLVEVNAQQPFDDNSLLTFCVWSTLHGIFLTSVLNKWPLAPSYQNGVYSPYNQYGFAIIQIARKRKYCVRFR